MTFVGKVNTSPLYALALVYEIEVPCLVGDLECTTQHAANLFLRNA